MRLGFTLTLCAIAVGGCGRKPADRRPNRDTLSSVTAITAVDVVDVVEGRLLRQQTVVIRDSVIAVVGPAARTGVPEGASVIDGAGRYLVPGLADMHVHLYTDGDLFTYVANGVTTVRNMAGDSTHLRMRRRVNEGSLIGPRILTAGPVVEAAPLSHPDNVLLERPSMVRAELTRQKAAGYDFVKVYNHLDRRVYDSVLAVGADLSLPVAGHVPVEVGLAGALAHRQRSIEHFRGYVGALLPPERALGPDASFRDWTVAWEQVDTTRIAALVERTVAAGSWNVATFAFTVHELSPDAEHAALQKRPEVRHLSLLGMPSDRAKTGHLKQFRATDYAAAQRGLENQFRLLRALDEAGAGLLPGTDSWLAGHAFADELDLLVRAGLAPARVLRMATLDAARFLGEDRLWGTVAAGRRADLVLLDENPLESIGAVRRIAAVILKGRVLRRAELDARLAALADSSGRR